MKRGNFGGCKTVWSLKFCKGFWFVFRDKIRSFEITVVNLKQEPPNVSEMKRVCVWVSTTWSFMNIFGFFVLFCHLVLMAVLSACWIKDHKYNPFLVVLLCLTLCGQSYLFPLVLWVQLYHLWTYQICFIVMESLSSLSKLDKKYRVRLKLYGKELLTE